MSTRTISKAAKMWILVLVAGLFAGVLGIVEHGWQHPADTIGSAVWLVLAVSVVVMIRREYRDRS